MGEPTRILIVEDLPTDAELAMREINKSIADCEFQRVETEQAFLKALNNFNPDLILSDYNLPRFTGLEALKLIKERSLLTPCIIYTGSINEDTAVDCMIAGAANYIIKENIKRLGSAVEHALEEKKVLTERKLAQDALFKSEARYRQLVEGAPDIVYTFSTKHGGIYYSPRVEQVLGYSPEFLKINPQLWTHSIHPDDRDRIEKTIRLFGNNKSFTLEYRIVDVNGNWHWLLDRSIGTTIEGDEVIIEGVATDITERKQAEEDLKNQLLRLSSMRTIDATITSTVDLRVTLNVLLEQVANRLNVDAGLVLLLDPNLNELVFAAGRGFRSNNISKLKLKIGEDYAGEAALKRRTISILDITKADHPFSKPSTIAGEDFVSFFAIPLIAKGQINGVLEIFHRTKLDPKPDWLDYLETLAGQAAIAIDSGQLFEDLQKSNTELILAYDATIEGWSRAMDLRDKETEGHTQRVTELSMVMARLAGINNNQLIHIRRGALLHDIGKLGVPDNILLKPDKLSDVEWEIMRKHPQYAYDMLSPIEYLRPALDIPYCHHEKWDGSGYPRGLKVEQIPFSARLFAIVDVWDALRSDRPYRASWPEEKVLAHIRDGSGTHFDPKAIEIFFHVLGKNNG